MDLVGLLLFYLGANPLHVGLYINVINQIESMGIDVNLVVNQLLDVRHPLKNLNERSFITKQIIRPSRQWISGKVYGPIIFHYRIKSLYLFTLLRILIKPYRQGKRIILHARTLHVADVALRLKRLLPGMQVISELEGDIESEVMYSMNSSRHLSQSNLRRLLRIHSHATQRVLLGSDVVLCVSNRLKEILTERHSLSDQQKQRIRIFPTVVSSNGFYFDNLKREEIRREWRFEDRFVMVYSGNLATPWQLPKETVDLFCMIRKIRTEALFLILSPETEHKFILPHLHGAGLSVDDYQLRSVVYEKMPACLCAADIGVALREKHLMNEVASPGKVVEYLLTGLPIILTEAVGEYPKQLLGNDLALVLSDPKDMSALEPLVRSFCSRDFGIEQRLKFSQWAAKHFSLEAWASFLDELYHGIITSPTSGDPQVT
jgi:glycosyltransferase involved in cell wall biosynthesis